MRKLVIAVFVLVLMLGGISVTAYAVDCTKDTPLDQAGDWFGTFGKTGTEKDQIMAKRKADRLVACAKQEAQEVIKEAQKAGNKLKKKFGF